MGVIVQLETPQERMGRVAAVNSFFIGSSNELGAFESGLAARLLGTVPSVVFGGAMTLLTVGLVAWRALACRGQSLHWLAAVPSLVLIRPELSQGIPHIDWLGPTASEVASGVSNHPAVPPPEQA